MKKNLTVLLAVLTVCCITLFAACNQYHEHTFATEWTYDETNHYHAATCEHTDQKGSFAAHAFDNGTVTENGVIYTCTVCGYEKTHNHTFAPEWTYDETNHYHAATCEHTDEKSDSAAHVFGDGTVTATGTEYVCGVCGYKKTQAFVYTVNQEEFASILSSINNYKVNVTSQGDEILIICSDVYYCAFPVSAEYWGYDGTDYVCLYKNADEKDWSKQIVTKEVYESRISSENGFPLLINCFSDFTYDEATKSYIAEEIITTYSGDDFTFRNLSLSFVDGKLAKATFTIVNPYGDTEGDVYVYTEIGTASATLPTNIHEHTYSEEWSFSDALHYHEAACGHYLKKDEANHTLVKGVCTVCGYNIVKLSDDGKTVIGVADNECTEVTIPQGVTTIGESAFYFCNKMTEIVIPDGVTAIEGTAFQTCSALQKIVLPEGLLTIGERAFERCSKLTEITIPSTVEQISAFSFINCSGLERVFLSEGNKSIRANAFKNCAALTDVLIPKSLTEIGADVFLSSSLSRIFYNGTEAEWASISINKYNDELKAATVYYYSETDLDEGNYWHYDEDGKVAVWPKHTYSEEWTFDETSHWHAATCEHTDKKYGLAAHEITVEETADGTKYICKVCGYYEVKESIYKVTESVFNLRLQAARNFKFSSSGKGVTEAVVYSDGAKIFDRNTNAYLFFDGTAYYKYTKETGYDDCLVEEITEDEYNDYLSIITILPAFTGSYSSLTYDFNTKRYVATNVAFGASVISELSFGFENGALKTAKIVIGESVIKYTEMGDVTLDLPTNLHEHTFDTEKWVSDSNKHWHQANCRHYPLVADEAAHIWQNGVCSVCGFNALLLTADGTAVEGVADKELTSFTFPAGVTRIGASVFENCKITEIDIPEGIEWIGAYAFNGCSELSRISLPSTLTTICFNAFEGCSALTSILIPDSVTRIEQEAFINSGLTSIVIPNTVTTVQSSLFENCTALTTATLSGSIESLFRGTFSGCTSLKTVILSEGTVLLSDSAFADSASLESIVIPKSLTDINSDVFAAPLKSIYYNGTSEDWGKIYISPSSKANIDSATLYYYSETEPEEDGNFWHYTDGEIVVWHRHSFASEWSYDQTSHWRAATCGHDDKKYGLAAHSFTESDETEEGTVYACSCGYVETRVSKYRVSAESFANLLNSANIFRITVEGSAKDAVYYKMNNAVRVEYADGSVEYYTKEDHTYYKYYVAESCDGWIKDVITESDYIRNAGRLNLLPYAGDSFSEFTFDITEKCYKSASLIAGGNELKDVVVRFENGRITEASFTTQGISFAYNDFDKVEANVPANLHEHTFSTEWSFNGNTHWHAATCGYTGITDTADHVFGESECTVCGYSLFKISSDGKKLIALNSPNVTSVTIPSGIVTIGDNVFAYSLLTSIVIPEGVEDIGKNAFCYSELLEQVTFPSTLLYIRDYAFQGCSKLASVEFPQTLNTIGEYAFADCTSLTELYVPDSVVTCGSYYCMGCTALTTVNVPRCVVDFVQGYLVDCPNIDTIVISGNLKKLNTRSLVNLTKLTTIVIPRSVTEIGYKVFSGSLKTVYYGGTEADWATIEFDEGSMIDSATVYYYSETEPNEAGNFWRYVDGVATKW